MNIKTTLALLVLLILVGIGWYVITNRPASSGGNAAAPAAAAGDRVLPEAKAVAIDRLAVTRGEQSATLERVAGRWMLVEPVQLPADTDRVDDLVQAAVGLEYVAVVTPGVDDVPALDALGLAPPRATLRLGEDGPTLLLGRSVMGGRAYVMRDAENRVYVADDTLQKQIVTGSLLDLRQRVLPAPAPESVTSATLQQEGSAVQLRRLDGDWRLGSTANEQADDDAVTRLLGALGRTRIQDFIADAPASLGVYGLESPRLRLTVAATEPSGGSAERTLRVGAPADLGEQRFYATWTGPGIDQPVVITLRRADVERLMTSADDLRDPRLLQATPASAQRMRIERTAGEPIVLHREGGQWGFAEGAAPFAADPEVVRSLVERLLTAEAAGYVADFVPAGEPVATLTVNSPARAEPETVAIYAAQSESDGYLAVPPGYSTAYELPAETVVPALVPLFSLRERTVLPVAPEDVTKVELVTSDGRAYTFNRDKEQWSLAGAAELERQAFNDLLHRLAPLEASGWTGDDSLPAGARIQVTLVAGDRHALSVAPRSRDATLDGVPGVFTIDEGLLDLLEAEYRDRRLFPDMAGAIRQVTISDGASSITIRREANGAIKAEPAISEEQAAAALNAVESLRVERYVDAPTTTSEGPGLMVTVEGDSGPPHTLLLRAPGDVLPSVLQGQQEPATGFIAPAATFELLSNLLPNGR